MAAISQGVKDRAAKIEAARKERHAAHKAAVAQSEQRSKKRRDLFHTVTGTKRAQAIAEATGISWLSVVISLFMLAFLLYIFASGSARIYYQLLFTSQSVSTTPNTTGLGTSSQSNQDIENAGNAIAPDIETNPQIM